MAFDPLSFIIGQQTAKGVESDYEVDELLDEINGEIVGELIVAQGSCGDSATYLLKDSGVLTISGTGNVTSSPWLDIENYSDFIESVVIADGITSIPQSGFVSCKNLLSVKLSNSLETINLGAFNSCTKLQSITIPASVKTIWPFVFGNCQQLSEVVFEDTVGWQIKETTGELILSLTSTQMKDSALMAEYLTDSVNYYCSDVWYNN